MGFFKNINRLRRVGKRYPRPTLAEGIRQAADAAEEWSQRDMEQRAQHRHDMQGADANAAPFEMMQAYSTGLAATGTVNALRRTGRSIDGVPVYRVELSIQIAGRAPYPSSYQTVIADAALYSWQPGQVLPFRVAPTDPHGLILG